MVSASRDFGLQGVVRFQWFWSVTVLSASRVLVRHGGVRLQGFWSVTVLCAFRQFVLSISRDLDLTR